MKRILCSIVLVCSFTTVFADIRTGGIDVFLLIDKSKSMNDYNQMGDMISWIETTIVNSLLQPGDWVYIDTFCGEAEHLAAIQIEDKTSIEKVAEIVKSIKPDGYYTDMGIALDTLQKAVADRKSNSNYKYAVILTDMIQQAAPESPYQPYDRNFSHAMLQNSRIDKYRRWKQITVNVNSPERVKAVAERCFAALQKQKSGTIDIPLSSF